MLRSLAKEMESFNLKSSFVSMGSCIIGSECKAKVLDPNFSFEALNVMGQEVRAEPIEPDKIFISKSPKSDSRCVKIQIRRPQNHRYGEFESSTSSSILKRVPDEGEEENHMGPKISFRNEFPCIENRHTLIASILFGRDSFNFDEAKPDGLSLDLENRK